MKAALLSTALILLCCPSVYPQSTSQTVAEKTTPAETAPVKTGKAALVLPPEKANPVKAVLFAKPPVIDGKLDDEVWKTAVVLKDFYQIQPGDNLIPENRTEVRHVIFQYQRAVSAGLGSQSGHGVLRRLQRRSEPEWIQSIYGAT